jgi:hypothetical protein
MKTQTILPIFLSAALSLIISATTAQTSQQPTVSRAVFLGLSKPVRDMAVVLPGPHEEEPRVVRNFSPAKVINQITPQRTIDKPVLQKTMGSKKVRGPWLNYEGVGNVNNGWPADPNGEVGPDHFVQFVNSSFAVWDKNGNLLYGPVDNKTIWSSLPGPWSSLVWSDPIFKYDHLADRWVVSSMSLAGNLQGPFYEMVAVSVSPDPLGEYYCYAYEMEHINDYQKMAVWPDGYYFTYFLYDYTNTFIYINTVITALDRQAMLTGASEIPVIQFEIPDPDTDLFFPMAADLRGDNIPPDAPCYIITNDDPDPENPWDLSLDVYEFSADWAEPENSQFDLTAQFDLGTFEPTVNWGPGATQKGSSTNILTLPIYMMYPVTYRMFEDHQTIVCCHSMWDGDINYIKWYELRKEQAGWYIYQAGNYAPDSAHYYYPSLSINGHGDMAMVYTVSSPELYPSIRMTGRYAADSLGVMTVQELALYNGLDPAVSYDSYFDLNRWGDYASMTVDPVDDTTFWFTDMYTRASMSPGNWATRIFSFTLSGEIAQPWADAGNDTLTCNMPLFTTQGHAENYSSIVWTSSGDGNFVINYKPNAVYHRGSGDLANGQVTLTMHLTGYEFGSEAADSMILYINKDPLVNAGEDMTIYANEAVTLQGNVQYSYDYYWSTLGDGIFSDTSLLDAIYTPGSMDIENQQVTLVLTAFEVAPCTGSASDSLTLFILPVGISENSGKEIALDLYPNPSVKIITIEAKTPLNGIAVLQVIDVNGKMIFTEKLFPGNHLFKKQLDFSYMEPGIYFVRLQSANASVTRKLIVTQ